MIMSMDLIPGDKESPPIEVPADSLSAETLTAVIESFILREGTDYGSVEISLATKIEQVRRQIEKGDVLLVFDSENEAVTLINRH